MKPTLTPDNPGDTKLVQVDAFLTPEDAHLARLKLETEGITVFLDNESIVSVNQLYGPATGGIKLMVPEPDVEHALTILTKGHSQKCPECDSTAIELKPMSLGFLIFSILLLTIPMWLTNKNWHCNSCGHSWK